MSLLDDRVDELHVFREVDGSDALGNPKRVPSDTPKVVFGAMQPDGSSETDDQNSSTIYSFRGRDFPAGAIARVTWVNHDGGEWDFDVIGEPKRRRRSPATAHVTVSLRARTSEPLDED